MARPLLRWLPSLSFLVAASVSAAHAQDARMALFDAYNHATTYEEVKPLVSGVLAQQYAFVASHDPRRLPEVLAHQQVTSYKARIVDIDDATSFLVLEQVTPASSRDAGPQAYLVAKNPAGMWTLANRMAPDSVLRTLWTRRFTPSDFAQPSSCAIDGRDIAPQSALAVRHGDSIEITLYPFMFSQADLDYWRQVSGIPVDEGAVAASHFNGPRPAVCRLIVKIDKANQLSLLNVGFDDRVGSVSRSRLWQPSKADVAVLRLERGAIDLATAGSFGTDADGIRWSVKIRVPVWEKGL